MPLGNGADRLAQCRVAINLHFVKNAQSAKHNKMKLNKTKSMSVHILGPKRSQITDCFNY